MSKINQTTSPPASAKMPWEQEAPSEVRGLRRAITADASRDAASIDSDVAPMVGDLLARLDAFVSPKAPGGPMPPSSVALTPAQMGPALRGAKSDLAAAIQRAQDPSSRGHLVALLQLLEGHMAMKDEVVWRVSGKKR